MSAPARFNRRPSPANNEYKAGPPKQAETDRQVFADLGHSGTVRCHRCDRSRPRGVRCVCEREAAS